MVPPVFNMCPLAGLSAGSRACAKTTCSFRFLLHKGIFLFVSLIFPAFLLFPPHYGGNLERKKGGWRETRMGSEHLWRNACTLAPQKNVCTSPRRSRDRQLVSLFSGQGSKQAKQPKRIKPPTNFNQTLYSLRQVKSLYKRLGLSCCTTFPSVKRDPSGLAKLRY